MGKKKSHKTEEVEKRTIWEQNLTSKRTPKPAPQRAWSENQQIVNSTVWERRVITEELNFFLLNWDLFQLFCSWCFHPIANEEFLSLCFAQSRAGGCSWESLSAWCIIWRQQLAGSKYSLSFAPSFTGTELYPGVQHCQLQMPGSNLWLVGYFHFGISPMFSNYSLIKKKEK